MSGMLEDLEAIGGLVLFSSLIDGPLATSSYAYNVAALGAWAGWGCMGVGRTAADYKKAWATRLAADPCHADIWANSMAKWKLLAFKAVLRVSGNERYKQMWEDLEYCPCSQLSFSQFAMAQLVLATPRRNGSTKWTCKALAEGRYGKCGGDAEPFELFCAACLLRNAKTHRIFDWIGSGIEDERKGIRLDEVQIAIGNGMNAGITESEVVSGRGVQVKKVDGTGRENGFVIDDLVIGQLPGYLRGPRSHSRQKLIFVAGMLKQFPSI
jgi:hypothetical protein